MSSRRISPRSNAANNRRRARKRLLPWRANSANRVALARENPRWVHVDVKFVKKTRLIPLSELRTYKPLAKMQLLQRGNRLSITPGLKQQDSPLVIL